jgi:hypothetical protein
LLQQEFTAKAMQLRLVKDGAVSRAAVKRNPLRRVLVHSGQDPGLYDLIESADRARRSRAWSWAFASSFML